MSNDLFLPDYKFRPGHWLIGGQMMFVAFGALVAGTAVDRLGP